MRVFEVGNIQPLRKKGHTVESGEEGGRPSRNFPKNPTMNKRFKKQVFFQSKAHFNSVLCDYKEELILRILDS